ncbi:hypothetical protein M3Y99_01766100 [Aphelenchoides fujianensis]|nr:hypothetical protein M3Y99_01766100 [Aphelenchoides fujianensis]
MCSIEPCEVCAAAFSFPRPNVASALATFLYRCKNFWFGSYFVLCLHNRIALLECYPNHNESRKHLPTSLHDLVGASALATDFLEFTIFFEDSSDDKREPLRFKARNQKERDVWIYHINRVFVSHEELLANGPPTNRIKPPEGPHGKPNIYTTVDCCGPAPSSSNQLDSNDPSASAGGHSPSPSSGPSASPTVLPPESPSSSGGNEPHARSRRPSNASFAGIQSKPLTPLGRTRCNTMNSSHVTICEGESEVIPAESQVPNPFSERKLSCCDLNAQPPVEEANKRRIQSILKRPMNTAADQENHTPLEAPPGDEEGYRKGRYYKSALSRVDSEQSEEPGSLIKVALVLSICTEDLKFVFAEGSYWVVGLEKRRVQAALRKTLHLGDQIVAINGKDLNSAEDASLMSAFFASSVAVPIQLTVRRLPFGEKHVLRKAPIQLLRKMGILFREGTSTIREIEPNSVAAAARLPAELPGWTNPNVQVPAVITEINGFPLELCKTEDVQQRFAEIPNGQSFEVVIHPLDLVNTWKAYMRLKGLA